MVERTLYSGALKSLLSAAERTSSDTSSPMNRDTSAPGGKAAHRFEAHVIFKGKGLNFRSRRPEAKDEIGWASFWDKLRKWFGG